jgi:hypothetical protein
LSARRHLLSWFPQFSAFGSSPGAGDVILFPSRYFGSFETNNWRGTWPEFVEHTGVLKNIYCDQASGPKQIGLLTPATSRSTEANPLAKSRTADPRNNAG